MEEDIERDRKPIRLNDLLHFDESEYENIRVKLNISAGSSDPMELFLANPEEVNTQWFLWREKNYYYRAGQTALCFIRLSGPDNTWLLTTIKHIDSRLDVSGGVAYDAHELDEYSQFFGRVIIRYRNQSMRIVKKYQNIADAEVVQILSDVYTGEAFPGYDNVSLTWRQLHDNILTRTNSEWIGALEGQKAVYVITDESNGKLYVGSATSNNGGLLKRWRSYAANGHGGNKELMDLQKEDSNYAKNNFRYSIIEHFNFMIDDDSIFKREAYWKKVLDTRFPHGYNDN